jgi:hypothetical protein
VDAAVSLVASGLGDTIVPKAVAESDTFPAEVYTTRLEEPIYDTFALVQRTNWELSPMASHLAELAVDMLTSNDAGLGEILHPRMKSPMEEAKA